jgi:hypothetical protein
LAERRNQQDLTVENFRAAEEKIRKNALRKPTEEALAERTGLQEEYAAFSQMSQEFFEYTLKADSHKKFLRRKDRISEDAAYALAKATELMGARIQGQEMEKTKKDVDKIDQEIIDLKKKLKELNE